MLPASKEDAQCTLATMAGGGDVAPSARTTKSLETDDEPEDEGDERAGH